jgi:hypothetical protein
LFLDEDGESRWDDIRFELMWIEHGGSGLNMSFESVGELDFEDISFLRSRQREQRRKEAEAMKSAARRK